MWGLVRALWPVLSYPLAGALGVLLLAAAGPLPASPLTLLAGVLAAALAAHLLVPWGARARAVSPRLEAWSRRRGRTRSVYQVAEVPDRADGSFLVGYRVGSWDLADDLGELAWDPLGGDHPHLVCSGTTGSGKTRLMVLLALQALLSRAWRWEVVVIDAKGGADYQVLAEHGARLALERADQVRELERCANLIRERNRVMRDARVPVPGRDGRPRQRAPRNLRELLDSEEGRRVLRTMPPVLVEIDETAEIVSASDALAKRGIAALRTIVQLGRSVGVHMVLGMQRPDANMLGGGFIKHNAQSRILLGAADVEAENMVVGAGLMAQLDDAARSAPRPAGAGLSADVGGFGLARFRAVLLDDLDLLPEWPTADQETEDLDVALAAALAGAHGSPPASSDASPSPASTLVAAPVGGVPPASARSGPGSSSPGSPLRRLLARPWLRLRSWRLLLSRRDLRPSDRDRRVVRRARRDHPDRCAACHDASVPLEVDHDRPLWAGGADLAHNLRLLCVPCHRVKTAAEARVRAAHERLAGLKPPRAPRPVVLYGGLAALGAASGVGLEASPLVTPAVALVGAGALLLVVRDVLSRGGLDRADTLDRRIESSMPGPAGALARQRDKTVVAWINLKLRVLGWSAAYVGGWLLVAWLAAKA